MGTGTEGLFLRSQNLVWRGCFANNAPLWNIGFFVFLVRILCISCSPHVYAELMPSSLLRTIRKCCKIQHKRHIRRPMDMPRRCRREKYEEYEETERTIQRQMGPDNDTSSHFRPWRTYPVSMRSTRLALQRDQPEHGLGKLSRNTTCAAQGPQQLAHAKSLHAPTWRREASPMVDSCAIATQCASKPGPCKSVP